MVHWQKPEQINGIGLVYVSKCRRFMVIRKNPTEYQLSYTNAQLEYVRVGPFSQLRLAKEAAEKQKEICG